MQFIQQGSGALMLERPAEQRDKLFFKHPEGKLARHCQVVVDASEVCVVTSLGKVLGVLPPGRHTLDPAHLPFLGSALDPSGAAFQVEAFFVTTRPLIGHKFAVPPGKMRDQQGNAADVMLFGSYTLRVADAAVVVQNVMNGGADPEGILHWTCDIVGREVKNCLATWVSGGHFGITNIEAAGAPLAQAVPPHCGETTMVALAIVGIDSVTVKTR